MESSLLDSIGIDPAFIFIGVFVILIILIVMLILTNQKLKKLNKKYDKFMRGKDAETLEDTILGRFEEIEMLKDADREKSKALEDIFENLQIAYQKCGLVKYNAFKEMGGNLSFAIALLNKENNGFVLNAMHSREGCYTYLKEIVKGESYVILADEEKEALEKAINSDNYLSE